MIHCPHESMGNTSARPQLFAQLLLHFITRNYKYFHFSKKYFNYVQQKNIFGIKY